MAGERSVAAVLTDLASNVQQIIQAEIRFAKVEVRQEVDKAKRSATLLIAGGTVALMALVFLACVYLLATVVASWIAALVVAAAAAGIGGALIAAGITQMQQVTVVLPKTVTTIEENLLWARTPTKWNARSWLNGTNSAAI